MEIKNNRLKGDKVHHFVKARSFGGTIKPDSIIIHYTAGPSGDATVRYFSGMRSKYSAHLVVHEAGTVTQMVDVSAKSYHAGRSSYKNRSRIR